jgi:hypothetical protein
MLWNLWFERIWIVQEVALARRLAIQYGNVEISWDTLNADISPFYMYKELAILMGNGTDPEKQYPCPAGILSLHGMDSIRTRVQQPDYNSFIDVLFEMQRFKSIDP